MKFFNSLLKLIKSDKNLQSKQDNFVSHQGEDEFLTNKPEEKEVPNQLDQTASDTSIEIEEEKDESPDKKLADSEFSIDTEEEKDAKNDEKLSGSKPKKIIKKDFRKIKEEFTHSRDYFFISRAVNDLKDGKSINYVNLKKKISRKWDLSTNEIYKIVLEEIERQGLDKSLAHQSERSRHRLDDQLRTEAQREEKRREEERKAQERREEEKRNAQAQREEAKRQADELRLQKKREREEEALRKQQKEEKISRFTVSPQYSFIQKAATKLKEGELIDYSQLKFEIGTDWQFLTAELDELVSGELSKEGLIQIELERRIRNKNSFRAGEEYKYVTQFAAKLSSFSELSDLMQLQMLLNSKNWYFSVDELKKIVSEEHQKQSLEKLKSKVLNNNFIDRDGILRNFLNFYRITDNTNIKFLALILEEKFLNKEDLHRLKNDLTELENKIKVANFEKRLAAVNDAIQIHDVDQFSGYEFEDFLKNLFSKMGYQVSQTKLSGDQGADLVVSKLGEKTVIQAKCYSGKVGNSAIQEIVAAISLYKAQRGMVVTNNYFTPAAIQLAGANNIELINRDALNVMINNYW